MVVREGFEPSRTGIFNPPLFQTELPHQAPRNELFHGREGFPMARRSFPAVIWELITQRGRPEQWATPFKCRWCFMSTKNYQRSVAGSPCAPCHRRAGLSRLSRAPEVRTNQPRVCWVLAHLPVSHHGLFPAEGFRAVRTAKPASFLLLSEPGDANSIHHGTAIVP